jgi:Zn finger protein HypA/HybF involved in hydrogenase expression
MRKFEYEYYCNDCKDDFISNTKETDCAQCLSSNIKLTAIEQWED